LTITRSPSGVTFIGFSWVESGRKIVGLDVGHQTWPALALTQKECQLPQYQA